MLSVKPDKYNFAVTRRLGIDEDSFHELRARLLDTNSRTMRDLQIRDKPRLGATVLSKTAINRIAWTSREVRRMGAYKLKDILNKNLPPTNTKPIEATIGKIGILGSGDNKHIAAIFESAEVQDEQFAMASTMFRLAKLPFEREPPIPHVSFAKFSGTPEADVIPMLGYLVGETIRLQPVRFVDK